MVDFKNNAAIVLSTLERYRYSPRIIAIISRCFDEFFDAIEHNEDT